MSNATVRIPMIDGDEVDYLDRHPLDQPRRPGVRRAARRQYNRRLHRTGRDEIRRGEF